MKRFLFFNYDAVFLHPGADPTIVSYNASAVKIYNDTSSLVRFKKAKMFSSIFKKAGVVVVN
jgi:hypothetical protein